MKTACLLFNPIQENTYVVWDDTKQCVVIDAGNSSPREDAALDNFIAMRAAEGAKMKADVESRLCFLEERVGRVETLSAGRVEAYTSRLYEKLKTILEDRSIDDARVLTEAAIFGDKTAVDEETVRLRSHIAQYRSILELDEPVGRKLDFLTQELNHRLQVSGSGHHPHGGGHEGGD